MSHDQGEGTFGTAPEPDQTIGDAPTRPAPGGRGPGLLIGVGIGVLVVLAVIVGFISK
jgi:hypothetical protein